MRNEIYKIVHVTAHMGGGAGKAVAGLICNEQIKETGLEHYVVLLEKPKEEKYMQICSDAGVKTVIYDRNNENEITKILIQADVIIINWWNHPVMPFFMSYMLSKIQSRWILWFHVNGCSYPYIPYLLLKGADSVLFTTNYSLENPLWSQKEKMEVMEKANLVLGMGEFVPERIIPKNSYASKEIRIGYVGTISYAKMHCKYLDYVERIGQEISNVRFILVGECDNGIRKEIEDRGLQNIVDCVGKVEDVYSVYRNLDILLYLLNADNYGTTENVLLEAMAMALPIIVFDNPIERNIIKDGICGYVVHNEDEIIEITKRLVNDAALRELIGQNARKVVLKKYNLQKNVGKYVEILANSLKDEKKDFPFQMAIGSTPFEWFLNFTGKEREKFQYLAEMEDNYERDKEIINSLSKIYVGTNKSSVFHFQNYYTEDERLNRICEKIKMFIKQENYDK